MYNRIRCFAQCQGSSACLDALANIYNVSNVSDMDSIGEVYLGNPGFHRLLLFHSKIK